MEARKITAWKGCSLGPSHRSHCFYWDPHQRLHPSMHPSMKRERNSWTRADWGDCRKVGGSAEKPNSQIRVFLSFFFTVRLWWHSPDTHLCMWEICWMFMKVHFVGERWLNSDRRFDLLFTFIPTSSSLFIKKVKVMLSRAGFSLLVWPSTALVVPPRGNLIPHSLPSGCLMAKAALCCASGQPVYVVWNASMHQKYVLLTNAWGRWLNR